MSGYNEHERPELSKAAKAMIFAVCLVPAIFVLGSCAFITWVAQH